MTGVNVSTLASSNTSEFDPGASFGDINIALMVKEHAPRKMEFLQKKRNDLVAQLHEVDAEMRLLDDLMDVINRHG